MVRKARSKEPVYDELVESEIDPDERQQMIAEAAYYRSAERGFRPGFEWDDWIAAENYVDSQLIKEAREDAEA